MAGRARARQKVGTEPVARGRACRCFDPVALENYVRYRFAFWETSPLDTSLIRVSGGSGSAGTGTKTASSYYTVKRGDTLWGIANTYGVTLTALLNVNPQIKNPNRIAVGERVTLP